MTTASSASPLVITANTRLARILRQTYDKQQAQQGLSAWIAPEILPIGAWLEQCWRSWLYTTETEKPAQLLSPTLERAIWEDIVARSDAGKELLQIGSTADAAMDAFRLMHEWTVPLDARDWQDSRDTEAFRGWVETFQKMCARRNWLPGAELPAFITERMNSGEFRVPTNIQLAGFTEVTPAHERLFDAMRWENATVEMCGAPTSSEGKSAVRIGFVDTNQEIRTAAQWARNLLESSARFGAPTPAIGIVVPELSKYRSSIDRLFSEELHPGGRLSPDQDSRRAFNISLGPSLSDYPLIQAALLVLRMNPVAIALDDWTSLMRSPFIAKASAELTEYALLDIQVRQYREPELAITDILDAAPPGLKVALDQWKREQTKLPSRQMPSDWATSFSSVLKSIGWPGDRPLNSAEFQTTAAWNEMIAEFAGLDSATGPLTPSAALSTLQRLASERQFQPESDPSPIQILGVLEASGMAFDHLWIVGMHDGAWPRSARPNPFLPLSLQREGNLPQSSPQRELEFTERLTKQLLASSPNVVVSYPSKDGDTELRHSPLFSGLSEVTRGTLELPDLPRYAKRLFDSSRLSSGIERIDDHRAPPWKKGKLRGGTAIFQYQAACPFRAFAAIRLGAEPLKTAEQGLSAIDRGNLVHQVLQRIWAEFHSHKNLVESRSEHRARVITNAVQAEIAAMALKKRALQKPRFAAIEQARLERLAAEWLELEKQRQPFIVLHPEEDRRVEVGGIHLNIRADRIDQLDDGSHVVVDYKTTRHGSTEWDGDRPDQPQLPLYAVTAGLPLSGVVFGVAKLGELKFSGLVSADGILPGVAAETGEASLTNRIPHWLSVLERLATDFRDGIAGADPKKPSQTCRHCGLQRLCRIRESSLIDENSRDGEFDAEFVND